MSNYKTDLDMVKTGVKRVVKTRQLTGVAACCPTHYVGLCVPRVGGKGRKEGRVAALRFIGLDFANGLAEPSSMYRRGRAAALPPYPPASSLPFHLTNLYSTMTILHS